MKRVARTYTHAQTRTLKERSMFYVLFARICCESARGSVFHTCKGWVTHTGNAEFATEINEHIIQIVFIFSEENWRKIKLTPLFFNTMKKCVFSHQLYPESVMTCWRMINVCKRLLVLISIKTWSTGLLLRIDFCLSGNLLGRVDRCKTTSKLVQAVKWGQVGGAQISTGVPVSAGI